MTRGFSTLKSVSAQLSPCSFELFSGISSHPAVFFSHTKPANSTFSHSKPAKRTGCVSVPRRGPPARPRPSACGVCSTAAAASAASRTRRAGLTSLPRLHGTGAARQAPVPFTPPRRPGRGRPAEERRQHPATWLCSPFFCRAARKQRRNDGGGDREPGGAKGTGKQGKTERGARATGRARDAKGAAYSRCQQGRL
jgi:hypothetical protein